MLPKTFIKSIKITGSFDGLSYPFVWDFKESIITI